MKQVLSGDLVIKTYDDKEIKIENAVINEVQPKPDIYYTFGIRSGKNLLNQNTEVIITVGNISRKKFIKFLMSLGTARNGAKDIANYIHKKYGCYNQAYFL